MPQILKQKQPKCCLLSSINGLLHSPVMAETILIERITTYKPDKIALAASILLVLLNGVGLIGLSLSVLRPLFLLLVPAHLLITLLLLLLFQPVSRRFIAVALLVIICGFALEFIGVQTGILFGEYWYGDALGFKYLGIPLIMGPNWLLLALGALNVGMKISGNAVMQVIIASGLTTSLDLVMEQSAQKLDFWHWQIRTI